MNVPGSESRDDFLPSLESGMRARQGIHARLHESLQHIFEQCRGRVDFDNALADLLLKRLHSGERVAPALFGHYFKLVDRIENGSLEQVKDALRMLLGQARGEPAPCTQIRPFNRHGFSESGEVDFRKQFVSDSLLDEQLGHLDFDIEQETVAKFHRALNILKWHAPQTFSEIEVLVCEFVPAHGKAVNGMRFDGCSSLERWGAVLVNATPTRTDLELSEVLTHESAHNALFAMAPVNFHVENDPEVLYKSPLRLDPRPMNGIYHATFVLARMSFAMREVAASRSADNTLRGEATRLADASARLFEDGYRVLAEHALYTPEGQRIMQDAARYMSGHGGYGRPRPRADARIPK